MAERIFLIVFPLFLIIAIGYGYARKKPINMQAANTANIDIFIPALLFSVLSAESFDFFSYSDLAISAAFIVLGSGIMLWPLCKILNIRSATFLPPMMFNNSGNLGLPLAVLAFGKEALPAAVVLFIVENTLHFSAGIYMLNKKSRIITIIKMPITLATFAGLAWSYFSLPLHPAIRTGVDMLGQISIPLMLFALGVRMNNVTLRHWKTGCLGAILCPASGLCMAIIVLWLFPLSTEQTTYLLLFSVLPPAVLNYILAERYQQEPDQVAAIVLLGNMASFAFIPIALLFIL